MKTLYRSTVRFQTALFIAERTFLFASQAEKAIFEDEATRRLSVKVLSSDAVEDVCTHAEAMNELFRERDIACQIAMGEHA
jgi:hypothetical protein